MTYIADLPPERQALAWSIISDADLPVHEDLLLRDGSHDFEEGVRWGLALTLAKAREVTVEEAFDAL